MQSLTLILLRKSLVPLRQSLILLRQSTCVPLDHLILLFESLRVLCHHPLKPYRQMPVPLGQLGPQRAHLLSVRPVLSVHVISSTAITTPVLILTTPLPSLIRPPLIRRCDLSAQPRPPPGHRPAEINDSTVQVTQERPERGPGEQDEHEERHRDHNHVAP